jgi:hypothetical protein
LNDSPRGAVWVSGSKTGGLRSLSSYDAARSSRARRSTSARIARAVVDLRERSGAEHLVPPEHLEEVELDVAEVGLVVAHDGAHLFVSVKATGRFYR